MHGCVWTSSSRWKDIKYKRLAGMSPKGLFFSIYGSLGSSWITSLQLGRPKGSLHSIAREISNHFGSWCISSMFLLLGVELESLPIILKKCTHTHPIDFQYLPITLHEITIPKDYHHYSPLIDVCRTTCFFMFFLRFFSLYDTSRAPRVPPNGGSI